MSKPGNMTTAEVKYKPPGLGVEDMPASSEGNTPAGLGEDTSVAQREDASVAQREDALAADGDLSVLLTDQDWPKVDREQHYGRFQDGNLPTLCPVEHPTL